MADTGIFDGEHVELLNGQLFTITIHPPHARLTSLLTEMLILGLRQRATVRGQVPLAASDISEPEPDLALVPRGEYEDDHPSRAFCIIEVSDSTLEKDRNIKGPLYATMAVPEYWIVNVGERHVEVYSQPVNGRFTQRATFGAGQSLAPAAFPDVVIAVDALFTRK
jgi:Uma2 family endonuclease